VSSDKSRVLLVPIEVDPRLTRPLPQALWDYSCHLCDKKQARWEVFSPDKPFPQKKGTPVCAICWLYESDWGKKRAADIEVFIRAVEDEASVRFLRQNGRLSMCRDADRIFGAIVMTSKMFEVHRHRGV